MYNNIKTILMYIILCCILFKIQIQAYNSMVYNDELLQIGMSNNIIRLKFKRRL